MSVVSNVQQSAATRPTAQYDVVVVGAGPYGLSVAAHLLGKGLNVAIFGKPLKLWREHMPKGMYLRSHWWATNLSDPQKKYGFEQFFRVSEYDKCYPVPIEAFIDYGMWFQKQVVPDVDTTYVSSIERKDGQFFLTLEDGRTLVAPAVVMAIGLYYYANRPAEFDHVSDELVTHSFAHADFSRFAGKEVGMIGGGQSGVEYSALLHEVGAKVHLITKRPIHWLGPDTDDQRSLMDQIRAPRAGIAPGWKNWALEYLPYLFQRFPQARKDRYIRNHYNAAGSDWLRDRVIGKVELHEGRIVEKFTEGDSHLNVTLSDGEALNLDHLILSTGYQVDIKRLSMLSPSLLTEIQQDEGTPILNNWFESSVPGLYFVGLSSLRSFGPLYRFVVGAKAAAPRVASAAARRATQASRKR
ncbi:MAG TPA: NAD(P)-binding domain-containing protein [Ktedonobacteraceae bacterium]|nr:NAD(P)-binding domain-containing protein [Ktedonobacteraceae bacterium]